MPNRMFHFKHQDGGITFIGFNDQAKVYSQDYYMNVGIMNAEESKPMKLKEIRAITKECIANGYKQVNYLPRD